MNFAIKIQASAKQQINQDVMSIPLLLVIKSQQEIKANPKQRPQQRLSKH
jgi:hypothetical protein